MKPVSNYLKLHSGFAEKSGLIITRNSQLLGTFLEQ
jgi:hypothetical protein